MKPGLVSVIIPAYNQGHYLDKAVQSVLGQTYPDFEIIIVDDGSTDNTASIGCSYTVPYIHYVRQENQGLSAARNTGLRFAQGEFISYLDSDDLFLPDKLKLLMEAFDTHPEFGFVAGQAIPINEAGAPIGKLYDSPIPEPAEELLLGNPLHVGSVLVRRTWQDRAGEFDIALRSYEDWDMWLRLVRLGCRMGWVDQPVSLYRFHTAQMTRIGSQMTNATFAVLEKVYQSNDLPPAWQALRDRAYSNASLRAMAQAYHAQDYPQAKEYLLQAVRLNPALGENQANLLANRLSALATSPKILEPLEFLSRIYAHLPAELPELRAQAPQRLSQFAMDSAFEANAGGNYPDVRKYIWQALRYQPGWMTNRGVLSVLARAYTQPLIKTIFPR